MLFRSVVVIRHKTTAVGPAAAAARLAVRATPNPARHGTWFSLAGPATGEVSLAVLDLEGRTVRRLTASAGARQIWWDGVTQSGLRAAPGVYQVVVRSGREVAHAHLAMVR